MTRPCSASLSMTPSASFPRRCSVFDGTGKRRAPDELRILKAVGRRPYHQRLYAVSDDSSNKRTQLFPVDLNAIVNALSKFSSFPLEQEEPSETVAASDTARSTPPGDLERDASGPGWPRPPEPDQVWETVRAAWSTSATQSGGPSDPWAPSLATGPIAEPKLSIQGLKRSSRVSLALCALESLKEHCEEIPDSAWDTDGEGWERLTMALLASSAALTARKWLGYVPTELVQEVEARAAELRASATSEGALAGPVDPSTRMARAENGHSAEGDVSGAEAAPSPLSLGEEGDLWGPFRMRTAIHAAVLRYLRFRGRVMREVETVTAQTAESLGARLVGVSENGATGARKGVPEGQGALTGGLVVADGTDGHTVAWSASESAGELGRGEERKKAIDNCAAVDLAPVPAEEEAWGMPTAMPPSVKSALRARIGGQLSTAANAGAVVEDMAVAIADAVAQVYLAEARQGREGGAYINTRDSAAALGSRGWPLFLHERIQSTRSLERFRNGVLLRRAVDWAWFDVVDVFEDCHRLMALGRDGGLSWRRMPSRRGDELGRLKGLRLWVSVVLEAGDVALPLIRAFWQRLGQAVSWLLVSLVGRALGLIWAGISMSMHGARQRDGSARRRSASKPGGPWPREAW